VARAELEGHVNPGRLERQKADPWAGKEQRPAARRARHEREVALSGNRSSLLRKRALRRLSHEQPAAYAALYEQVLAETPGLTRHQARPRAWTRLRHEFPDRYLELLALEHGSTGADLPPEVRSKSWQRACGLLAERCAAAYRARYAEFRAQGMAPQKAYDRAIAAVRQGNADLFMRLLAEQYQRWLTQSDAATPGGDHGSDGG
jgi:hypothetical protein